MRGVTRENGGMSFDRATQSTLFRICFVCTGNICRSPMAEAVFHELLAQGGYDRQVVVSSAATGDWHVGERADPRTVAALNEHGYDGSQHRARQFDPTWFPELDLVVAFDHGQERVLRSWATTDEDRAKVQLLRSFDPDADGTEVPDPYYSSPEYFHTVLGMIERASRGLFAQLEPGIRQGAR